MPLCADCRRGEFGFDRARSYGLYRDTLRAAILKTKFSRRERLGRRLGERLVTAWKWVEETADQLPPILVPVPLHPSRQRLRGFNQAELLAEGLLRQAPRRPGLQPRLEAHCLRRTRDTVPQTGLSRRARRENVRGVFAVERSDRLRDRVVLLVDDVMTTGATASACARALKEGGARQVLVLTLARATPQFPNLAPPDGPVPVDDEPQDST